MDALSITVLCLIILVIASFIFLPMLKYKLSFRDVTKFYFNDRYQLFVYAHYHYAKVRSGKQSYDKYCNYIKQLYNKDNFNKAKSEHDNNRRRIDLCFLAGVLDDEQFVRSHFSGDSLPFEKFTQMNDEWEMMPIVCPDTDNPDVSTDIQSEDDISSKPKTTRNVVSALFKDILLEGAPLNTENFVSKYVRVKQKATDLANLYYALQEAEYINCDWKTFYNAVKNSFPEYVNREERTYRGARTKRDRTTDSYEVWENHQIEQRIIKQIKEDLNP